MIRIEKMTHKTVSVVEFDAVALTGWNNSHNKGNIYVQNQFSIADLKVLLSFQGGISSVIIKYFEALPPLFKNKYWSQTKKESSSMPHLAEANSNAQARFFGGALSGLAEIVIFHPLDTVGKRLMANRSCSSNERHTEWLRQKHDVIFREQSSGTFIQKLRCLYPGFQYGVLYKVSQRILRYGGQPYAFEYIDRILGKTSRNTVLKQALAGSLIGLLEVALLPLDTFKIKQQTNPEDLRGRSQLSILRSEGLRLYKGATWTAARNVPGQFANFGGNSILKQAMGLDGKAGGKADFFQNIASSAFGSVCSLVASQPMDVIKTRIQHQPFSSNQSGWTLVSELIRNEGYRGLLKGLPVKLLVVAPKLTFSMTFGQTAISKLSHGEVTALESTGGRYSYVKMSTPSNGTDIYRKDET